MRSRNRRPDRSPLTLVVRDTHDFEAVPERRRPGGSSLDVQFFKEKATNALWIGKCGPNAALSFTELKEQQRLNRLHEEKRQDSSLEQFNKITPYLGYCTYIDYCDSLVC